MNKLMTTNTMTSMQIAEVTGKFPNSQSKDKGLTYILESGNHVKIGRTKNLHQRLSTVVKTSGRPITRVATSPFCNNYCHIETQLHRQFSDVRCTGEWFAVRFDEVVSAMSKLEFDLTDKPSKENGALKLFEMAMRMEG
jgi:hypothetical protein